MIRHHRYVTEGNTDTPTDRYLRDAMAGLAQTDPELLGRKPTKWVLVIEHDQGEDAIHPMLSIFKSSHSSPWDRLGLLRFATVQVEAESLSLQDADEGDDDEED